MKHADILLVHQMMLLDANLADPVLNGVARQKVEGLVQVLLSDLCMEKLGDLQFYEATDLRAPGWSFVQPITTSHLSGHYFEIPGETPHIHIDVYSCKPFNYDMALAAVHSEFSLGTWAGTLVIRDLDLTTRTMTALSGDGDRIVERNKLSIERRLDSK